MQIFVKTIENNTITLNMTGPLDKIIKLKAMIAERTNVASKESSLNYRGKPLVDYSPDDVQKRTPRTLHDYGIQEGATIHQFGTLLGGH